MDIVEIFSLLMLVLAYMIIIMLIVVYERDCPYRTADVQDDWFDDSNAYAGKSEQVIRITQPITVATRDNIYKHMATQRTRANLYKAGYRRTKAAL